MKTLRFITVILVLLSLTIALRGQDNVVVPQRTPEQEAAKQTEKLQQELSLSPEQTRQIYEINLKYARERQISNTRSEAMERMKNKSNEVQRILNAEQNNRLQTKRYERSVNESSPINRMQQTTSAGFRAPTEYRQPSPVRQPSADMNLRNTYRSTVPTQSGGGQTPQTVRRSTPTNTPAATLPQSAPSTSRSTSTLPTQPAQSTRSAATSTPSSTNSTPTRSSQSSSSANRR